MFVIDRETVNAIADYRQLVAALTDMYRTGVDALERTILTQPAPKGGENDCLIQTAWMRDKAFGMKIANVFPDNLSKGIPSVVGLYVLFSGTTGEPMATIDGVAETFFKTASNSAVASDLLARKDSRVLAMFGAGKLAPHLVKAHAAVRPIERVLIWNRTHANAETLAAELKAVGLSASATADPATAASEADIVSAATFATEPIVKGAWLKPGAHVDLVGGYTPAYREADGEVVKRSGRLYVDSRQSTVGVCGDVIGPVSEGVLAEAKIADLFELAQGKAEGRRGPDDITVFKSGGGGHEDLAAALALYAAARARRAG
ncbi:MAG: ornithine cyclodeaminase family protein [Hyphomicrobiaceae bacterium]